MLTTKSGFRALVAVSMVLGLFSGSIDYLFPNLVPAELQKTLQELETINDKTKYIELGFALVLTFTWLVSIVGLLVFWSPARPIFVASSLVHIAWMGTLGPQLMSGQSEALMLLSEFAAGTMSAVMYTKPAGAYFKK